MKLHTQRCKNHCNFFENKPSNEHKPEGYIGWCHIRNGHLLITDTTYDSICYFGCASHSNNYPFADYILKKFVSLISSEMVYDDGDMYYKVDPDKYADLINRICQKIKQQL